MATTDASEEAGGLSVRAPVEAIDTSPRGRDALAALAQFAAAPGEPQQAAADPLAVARARLRAGASQGGHRPLIEVGTAHLLDPLPSAPQATGVPVDAAR